MAIYKHGRGFELGTTMNKSSKWGRRIASPTRVLTTPAPLSPEVKVIHSALKRLGVIYHVFKE